MVNKINKGKLKEYGEFTLQSFLIYSSQEKNNVQLPRAPVWHKTAAQFKRKVIVNYVTTNDKRRTPKCQIDEH